MRVPLGTAAGVVAWILARRGDDPPGVFELGLFVIVGALAGEYWAVYQLERQYRRRYKDSVLPQITSELGNLSYREASQRRSGASGGAAHRSGIRLARGR